jgi:hypothetical protein
MRFSDSRDNLVIKVIDAASVEGFINLRYHARRYQTLSTAQMPSGEDHSLVTKKSIIFKAS